MAMAMPSPKCKHVAQVFAAGNDGVRHRREHWFLFPARGAFGGRYRSRYSFRGRSGNYRTSSRKRRTEPGCADFRGRKAAWSSSSPVFFARADAEVSPDRGLGHVIDNGVDKSAPSTIRVEAIAVDEYVGKADGPDFIKCDVEGAEVEVFRGANKLLNEKRPIILWERHGDEARQTLLRCLQILAIAVKTAAQIISSRSTRVKFFRVCESLFHHCLASTATIFASAS
jgi:FkbM family methyltransferase